MPDERPSYSFYTFLLAEGQEDPVMTTIVRKRVTLTSQATLGSKRTFADPTKQYARIWCDPFTISIRSDLFFGTEPVIPPGRSLTAFISPPFRRGFSQRQGRFKPFGASDGDAECESCEAHSVRVGVLRCDATSSRTYS